MTIQNAIDLVQSAATFVLTCGFIYHVLRGRHWEETPEQASRRAYARGRLARSLGAWR